MTAKARTDLLTTTELYYLDQACLLITQAFGGECPYLVGSAGIGNNGARPRDADVRLILDDAEFTAACPTRERWELLCLAIGTYLAARTGLPVDFQIQRAEEANTLHGDKPRNPLGVGRGMGRIFAGGGDGTPPWGARDDSKAAVTDEKTEIQLRDHSRHHTPRRSKQRVIFRQALTTRHCG
jgi:hypothetical protein